MTEPTSSAAKQTMVESGDGTVEVLADHQEIDSTRPL
jgi:hypothetical protein